VNISSPFLIIGLLLVTGLLFGLLASKLKIPRIAMYALAGLLWSEDLLGGYFGFEISSWSGQLTNLALAIIAYTIGGSVTKHQLSQMGKTITLCTLGESLGAAVVVFIAVLLYQPDITEPVWILALILGGLAATTDPAVVVAVIHQYRTKGPVTNASLGVAALDDVFGIILFSILLVFVTGTSLSDAFISSLVEIVGALILGFIMGSLLAYFGDKVKNQRFFLPMVFSTILLSQGLAELLHFSPLLTAMTIGFSARSFYLAAGDRLFAPVEFLEELVFIIFFTLAGAYFQFSVFQSGLDLVWIYVLTRIIGKIVGINLVALFVQTPVTIRRYLGLSVVPQAGVAIGLALSLVQHETFHDLGLLAINTVLASSLIYEIAGPFVTRIALQKAGEVNT
jgi:Kef-type K+ transport system membrane component KefB